MRALTEAAEEVYSSTVRGPIDHPPRAEKDLAAAAATTNATAFQERLSLTLRPTSDTRSIVYKGHR